MNKIFSEIPTKNTLAEKKLQPRTKKAMSKKMWNQKMDGQGQCNDSVGGNKILIITIQAAKY